MSLNVSSAVGGVQQSQLPASAFSLASQIEAEKASFEDAIASAQIALTGGVKPENNPVYINRSTRDGVVQSAEPVEAVQGENAEMLSGVAQAGELLAQATVNGAAGTLTQSDSPLGALAGIPSPYTVSFDANGRPVLDQKLASYAPTSSGNDLDETLDKLTKKDLIQLMMGMMMISSMGGMGGYGSMMSGSDGITGITGAMSAENYASLIQGMSGSLFKALGGDDE